MDVPMSQKRPTGEALGTGGRKGGLQNPRTRLSVTDFNLSVGISGILRVPGARTAKVSSEKTYNYVCINFVYAQSRI